MLLPKVVVVLSGFDLVDGDYYNETLTDPFEDSDASQYAVG